MVPREIRPGCQLPWRVLGGFAGAAGAAARGKRFKLHRIWMEGKSRGTGREVRAFGGSDGGEAGSGRGW